MTTTSVAVGNLAIEKVLHDLVNLEIIPGTGVSPDTFWQGFEGILAALMPRNQALLARPRLTRRN